MEKKEVVVGIDFAEAEKVGDAVDAYVYVINKSKSNQGRFILDSGVLFIDATKECVKVTNNNKLTDENIESILNNFKNREDVEYISSGIRTARRS